MISMRFPEDCCKSKITNLNFPLIPINKDIVTLEISMDYRRLMAMQIMKPPQNLPAPMLHRSNINSLMLQPIPMEQETNKICQKFKTTQKAK